MTICPRKRARSSAAQTLGCNKEKESMAKKEIKRMHARAHPAVALERVSDDVIPVQIDELVLSTEQANAHHSSARINSQREVLQFQCEHLDNEILALTNARTKAIERKTRLQSTIVGLRKILDNR